MSVYFVGWLTYCIHVWVIWHEYIWQCWWWINNWI